MLCGLAADSGQCTQRACTAGLQTGQSRYLWPCLTLSFLSVAESQFLRNVFYSHCTWWMVGARPVPHMHLVFVPPLLLPIIAIGFFSEGSHHLLLVPLLFIWYWA